MSPTRRSSSEVILRVHPPGKLQSHHPLREYHVYLMDCVLCTYLTVWGFVFSFCCTLFVLIRGVEEQFNVNYCWQY